MEAHDELEIHALWARGEQRAALVLVVRHYQDELYGFLLARFPGQPSLADDAFSELCEDLLRGLPAFRWRCSMRTWCYRLARSAASRVGRAARPGERQHVRLSDPQHEGALLAQPPRSTTAPYMRDEVKERIARLREELSIDDRELLTLRIDRGLSFREIAQIMLPLPAADDDGSAQRRNEAALRQRLAEVKKRLRKRAAEAGLG